MHFCSDLLWRLGLLQAILAYLERVSLLDHCWRLYLVLSEILHFNLLVEADRLVWLCVGLWDGIGLCLRLDSRSLIFMEELYLLIRLLR